MVTLGRTTAVEVMGSELVHLFRRAPINCGVSTLYGLKHQCLCLSSNKKGTPKLRRKRVEVVTQEIHSRIGSVPAETVNIDFVIQFEAARVVSEFQTAT